MGVDIEAYRARIGTFWMPCKKKNKVSELKIPSKYICAGVRLFSLFGLLLVMGGDVETNPGPNSTLVFFTNPSVHE